MSSNARMGGRTIDKKKIDLLLSRLSWPSPLVRERAAVTLTGLLAGPHSTVIGSALLEWIQQQTLESVAVLGLLPFCRACGTLPSIEIFDESLALAVRKPSLLSDLIFQDLGIADSIPLELDHLHSGTAPIGFEPRAFFREHIRMFVPPIYSIRAEKIEHDVRIPFMRQWAFEWEALVETTNITPTMEPAYFWGREDDKHLPGMDTRLSEVYRSAYLRALAWSVTTGWVSLDVAMLLAAETCPIDLELWKLKPGRRPNWWPEVRDSVGGIDTLAAQIWGQVEELWDKQCAEEQAETILAAGGRVHQGDVIYDIEILGVFQSAEGPESGDARDIFERCDRVNLRESSKGLRLAGVILPESPASLEVNIGDWVVVPASGRVWSPTSSRWQIWRFLRAVRLPAPFLFNGAMTFRCGKDAIEISDPVGVKARLWDWTDGLSEKLLANLPPRSGYALTADTSIVRGFAQETAMTFVWVCRLSGYHRQYGYGKFEKVVFFRNFGMRNIVLPR